MKPATSQELPIPFLPRPLLYAALVLLYLLHNDFWLWHDSDWWLGLPVGMTYHIFYCLVAMVMLVMLVRYAWPHHLEVAEVDADSKGSQESSS